MAAYSEAIAAAVGPGSVVLDIGTGVGIFAILACKLGAKKVYAVESENIIQLALENAIAAGVDNRIEFIKGTSTTITLPEKVDLIVSDLRGVLPFFFSHIPSIIDARERFLLEPGRLIPQVDKIWCSLVEAADLYEHNLSPWESDICGIVPEAGRRYEVNNWWKVRLKSEQFLVEPQNWATLDYATVQSPDVKGELSWTATRTGTAHGLCVWFDTELWSGISFSNAPDAPTTVYGQAFFPLLAPVDIQTGDQIKVTLQARLISEDYIWRWTTTVSESETGREKTAFTQNTFCGQLLVQEDLKKSALTYLPKLNKQGKADHLILSLMDGKRSVGDVAEMLLKTFPDEFRNQEEAAHRVIELAKKFSL